ncbi:MAG TPA: glycine cleavage system protein GcvH [Phycisphaerae bacterium]|nr:glycine cleavage system protein GcvH [Phycisphaerae bacterium]HRR84097.1 glycine cleavage system protein GcvH [Phycisphaerae bacterium]
MSPTPSDRKYTKTHEWCLAEGDVVTIGITQFATDQLADITFVDLPSIGTRVTAGQACGEIESVKATSELYTAVSGEVIEVNKALGDAPELVNNDPYGQGWMVKIRAANLSELDALMDAAAYDRLLAAAS